MVRITARVPEWVRDQLCEMAEHRSWPLSAMLTACVDRMHRSEAMARVADWRRANGIKQPGTLKGRASNGQDHA
jgi:hypothetical protein